MLETRVTKVVRTREKRAGRKGFVEELQPDQPHLGVRADDFERLGLPGSFGIELSEADHRQLAEFRICDWLKSNVAWQREFDRMCQHGFKVDVEAVAAVANGYLTKTYLR
jgi:DNA topoisomerase VI subunit A